MEPQISFANGPCCRSVRSESDCRGNNRVVRPTLQTSAAALWPHQSRAKSIDSQPGLESCHVGCGQSRLADLRSRTNYFKGSASASSGGGCAFPRYSFGGIAGTSGVGSCAETLRVQVRHNLGADPPAPSYQLIFSGRRLFDPRDSRSVERADIVSSVITKECKIPSRDSGKPRLQRSQSSQSSQSSQRDVTAKLH